MDDKLKLSVCITNYNQLEYIEEAVESVLKQKISYAYEILLGDDGSDDGSYELIKKKYGHMHNVRIFRQKRDNPVKEYANWRHAKLIIRLMEEVKGEYFSILDGDDYYCDIEAFQRKIDILDKKENQDCILCNSNMIRLIDGKEIISVKRNVPQNKKDLKHVFFKNADPYIHLATAVIRSSVIQYVDKKYTKDWADVSIYFWLLNFGKRYYDPHITFCYRIHSGTICNGSSIALNNLRNVLDDDVAVCQWKRYSLQKMVSRSRCYLYLYQHRFELREMIDYDMWYSFAKQYDGWALKFMDYERMTVWERIKINCALLGMWFGYWKSSAQYIYESIDFLIDSSVTWEEKKDRVFKVLMRGKVPNK